jgi:hypothetical protein
MNRFFFLLFKDFSEILLFSSIENVILVIHIIQNKIGVEYVICKT